jgi:DNA gyrase subunit A
LVYLSLKGYSVSDDLRIIDMPIEEELKRSYIDYAMSVIVGRALPDVRDGLKPVHRRVLFAMSELNNHWNKPYKKSARVVGDVIGKYHPHGDVPVYDAIVRMAQNFSMRYTLVDGQGNFGSVDGDSPAAMRYTEIRMTKIAQVMLADLEKNTVDFVPNYDNNESMPLVLPAHIPNLLLNGSSGIAVGMATNIPPHNLEELIKGTLLLLEKPEANTIDLMEYIKGPDFPTGGIINGTSGLIQAYETGRGKILIRGVSEIEINEKTGKEKIIITEIPYQVNKARLVEKIAELVKEKKCDGIVALRDESDRTGMRIVVEVRRGENAEIILNKLYVMTQLQVSYGINMVALDRSVPKCMNLKQILVAFLNHAREVENRRCIYDLEKAKQKSIALEALTVALANIDLMIEMIKSSDSPKDAKKRLVEHDWDATTVIKMLDKFGVDLNFNTQAEGLGISGNNYQLSEGQAQTILDMKLHRLTGLEQEKITTEFEETIKIIKELIRLLSSESAMRDLIKSNLQQVLNEFKDPRRTVINHEYNDLNNEDLIKNERVVVTISKLGYVKVQSLESYQSQRRGGKGKMATQIKDEDYIETLKVANLKDTLLIFTSVGKLYWIKSYQLPFVGRASKGRPINNFLPLIENEEVTAILALENYSADSSVFMSTARGYVKRVALQDFSRSRASGIRAIDLQEDDTLIGVIETDGSSDIMLFSSVGKAIRFSETEVRIMGRQARGVRGIKLKAGQSVISMVVANNVDQYILTASENGYGKCTKKSSFRIIARGGQGVIAMNITPKTGKLICAKEISEEDDIIIIADKGKLVRISTKDISKLGRNTQGVRLIKLSDKGEKVISFQTVSSSNVEDIVESAGHE